MDTRIRAAMDIITRAHDDPNKGRPLAELIKGNYMLKGMVSQRLRTYCTSECMEPSRDLDEYGELLGNGVPIEVLQTDFELRITIRCGGQEPENEDERAKAHTGAVKELYDMRWGPTKVPIYNLLGLAMIISPARRQQYLAIARYLIDEVKVPVDGADLSGTTALSHAFSTKPAFDLEYAQMLYDAGGDVNHRNRYGCIVAQEITQIWTRTDQAVLGRARTAFEWFLSHGGNVDIADTDGWTVRKIVERGRDPGLTAALAKEDKRRTAKGDACCKLCGRDDAKLLQCGRCKNTKYCQPNVGRQCQKLDWPRHKKQCKA